MVDVSGGHYPSELVERWTLADGAVVEARPIRPEDAEMEQTFVRKLSDRSRYFRFMNSVRELTPSMLKRFTEIDYDRDMAFVVVRRGEEGDEEIAVARYVTNPDGRTCEFAVVVADAWQRKGLGRRLLETLIAVARSRGLEVMMGHVLATNDPMLALCARLGFRIGDHPQDATVRRATLPLSDTAAKGGR
jgi:acetyltransferase